jgi:hypothetical protein
VDTPSPSEQQGLENWPREGRQREFDDPIPLPDGRTLVTLRDAATYITELPKKESAASEWQTAIETLMRAAERGWPVLMARIGVLLALNRGRVREFNASRKDPHWGRRKLKRDQQ